MILKIPTFGYTFQVTQKGILPIAQKFQDSDDKILYHSILEGLNVDFKHAPTDLAYTNPLQQKVVYVMRNNQQYHIEVDEVIDIRSGIESLRPDQFVIMMNKMSPNKKRNVNMDLQ